MSDHETTLRMDAYYYGFEPTGNHAIDRILSAVACAGKAYHNTGDWTDDKDWQGNQHAPHPEFGGASPVEWIQRAANDAAAGADALRRGTCGTCKHVDTTNAREGTGECNGPSGSIFGWVPLHASCARYAPTEPTR
jgi:hypothetical protein